MEKNIEKGIRDDSETGEGIKNSKNKRAGKKKIKTKKIIKPTTLSGSTKSTRIESEAWKKETKKYRKHLEAKSIGIGKVVRVNIV